MGTVGLSHATIALAARGTPAMDGTAHSPIDAEQDEARRAQKTFVGEVLPALREVHDAA